MREKFFTDTEVCPLGKKILQCLNAAKTLTPDHPDLRAVLLDYRDQLISYGGDPKYIKLPDGIKREARLLLRTINEKLKHYPSMVTQSAYAQECIMQIPSPQQLAQMEGMPAGANEDQSQRLKHMVDTINQFHGEHPLLPLLSANDVSLPIYWQKLFTTIDYGNKVAADKMLRSMPATDYLFNIIISVHPLEYLLKLAHDSILALKTGVKNVGQDIIVTPKTFEILIKDVATTIAHPSPLFFSFGLPTHHAFNLQGSGFCVLNKTAMLMNHVANTQGSPVKYIIVGMDVNRDNGLCKILMTTGSNKDISHFDIFDPRVYPVQNFSAVDKELNCRGLQVVPGVNLWSVGSYNYYALALNLCHRVDNTVHPTLIFTLLKIKDCIAQAQLNNQRVAIFLPTGWDSHRDETAYCGKFINGHLMQEDEANLTRFNDADLIFFYQSLFQLYNDHKAWIAGIYWGLEGGYDQSMYQRQIQLLLGMIDVQLQHQVLNPNTHVF